MGLINHHKELYIMEILGYINVVLIFSYAITRGLMFKPWIRKMYPICPKLKLTEEEKNELRRRRMSKLR
jgi:hypothetical protein